MYSKYSEFQNTFASTLSGNVKGDNVNARIRNYSFTREAATANNHIPEQVDGNLVSTINKMSIFCNAIGAPEKQFSNWKNFICGMMILLLGKMKIMEFDDDEANKMMLIVSTHWRIVCINRLKRDLRIVEYMSGKQRERSGAYFSGAYGMNSSMIN